ncbi:MAG: hypothetical protein P8X51_17015, partial [Maritimibacter sp.]
MIDGGRYVLWLQDDHYWTYDVETGERTELTSNLPTSFVDVEDDHSAGDGLDTGVVITVPAY